MPTKKPKELQNLKKTGSFDAGKVYLFKSRYYIAKDKNIIFTFIDDKIREIMPKSACREMAQLPVNAVISNWKIDSETMDTITSKMFPRPEIDICSKHFGNSKRNFDREVDKVYRSYPPGVRKHQHE